MIDKRMMYALGQRVGFRGGGMDAGAGQDFGGFSGGDNSPAAGGTTGGTTGGGGNNNSGGGNDGPSYSPHTDINPTPIDRSAVSQFSTFGRNTMNQNLQGPTLGQRIGGGISTLKDIAGSYIKSGGTIGMVGRGLSSLLGGIFGGPKSFEDQYGYATDYQGTTGPSRVNNFNEDQGSGDNQGIMAAYNPNFLPVEEEVLPTQEEEDFIQRFRVANEFRQDKQGQLDPAILEMISKLYT